MLEPRMMVADLSRMALFFVLGTPCFFLQNAKRQLTGRIDTVSKTLTDSVQVQLAIKKDVRAHPAISMVCLFRLSGSPWSSLE